ncbi:MAG: hypothetical protein WC319_13835 [Candidatus Paceibacterota bacterium]
MRQIPKSENLRTFQDLKNVCSMLTGSQALVYIASVSDAERKKMGANKAVLTALKDALNERKKAEKLADMEHQKKVNRLSLLESRKAHLAQELVNCKLQVSALNEAKEHVLEKATECNRLLNEISAIKKNVAEVKPVEEIKQLLDAAVLSDKKETDRAGKISAIKGQIADLKRELNAAMRAAKKAGARQETIRNLRAEITRAEKAQADAARLSRLNKEWMQADADLKRMMDLKENENEITGQLAALTAEIKDVDIDIKQLNREVNNG